MGPTGSMCAPRVAGEPGQCVLVLAVTCSLILAVTRCPFVIYTRREGERVNQLLKLQRFITTHKPQAAFARSIGKVTAATTEQSIARSAKRLTKVTGPVLGALLWCRTARTRTCRRSFQPDPTGTITPRAHNVDDHPLISLIRRAHDPSLAAFRI